MKRIPMIVCMAFVFLAGKNALAQSADSADMMANWIKYMTPGEEHKLMASWDGTWNGEITMWMAPGAPPSKSTGTQTSKMILDGRYQQSWYEGNFEGMPFQGFSIVGYDNAKKKFVSTWIDNMGTGMMTAEGEYDKTSNSIEFTGTMIDPMTGKDCDFREIFKIINNDTQTMEMFIPGPDGKEYKSMEIKYTRKK